LVLVDTVVGAHLWKSGWPKSVSVTDVRPGVAEIQVTLIRFTGADWLVLSMIVVLHAVLFFLVWKAWRSSPVRA